jgi:hypothetical protein
MIPIPPASNLRVIATILAHGIVRLHQRQKQLDNSTEQSVHVSPLTPKETT